MMTQSAEQALSILRDPSQFQWYIVPILLIVIYIYNVEIGKKNWKVIFAGLALWGCDWFNEILNSLVFHFTQYAPIWGAPAKTAYLILIGLNIEITFMFSIMGIAAVHALPEDKKVRIMGIPNRLVFAVVFTTACVLVEVLLNMAGALTWDYSWWNTGAPWLIWLIGYFYFFLVCFWVHDMESVKKQGFTVGCILGFDAVCLIVFGPFLKWI
ncbi:MAG: hypothetical protein GY847_10585 [Proteobacteria bacterium]|nr:hypothetical protein [Pseudomonadota bacterium]